MVPTRTRREVSSRHAFAARGISERLDVQPLLAGIPYACSIAASAVAATAVVRATGPLVAYFDGRHHPNPTTTTLA
jgi:hypothetical protein